jgi:hypothetical protein
MRAPIGMASTTSTITTTFMARSYQRRIPTGGRVGRRSCALRGVAGAPRCLAGGAPD